MPQIGPIKSSVAIRLPLTKFVFVTDTRAAGPERCKRTYNIYDIVALSHNTPSIATLHPISKVMAHEMMQETSNITCLEENSVLLSLQEEKVNLIRQCLAQDNVDLWRLRELALTRGGLVNAEMRRAAWHLLVGLDRIAPCQRTCSLDKNELDLIHRDANRSVLFRYHKRRVVAAEDITTPSGESTAQRDVSHAQQEQLATVLSSALSGQLGGTKKLHYYQGLQDIAGVLLHNLQDTDHACAVLQRLCRLHLRDALREDLTHWTWLLDTVLLPILDSVDQELHDYLLDCGLECSNAILPWLITWFTHDIHDEQVASRLMDVLLSSHALFPLYFAVAVLVHPLNRREILESDCDPATIHMLIRSLLSNIVNDWESPAEGVITAQELIGDAISFMRQTPPRSLLALAGSYNNEDPRSYTNKAAYVSLLKAPPSWALAANMSLQWQQDKENVLDTSKHNSKSAAHKTHVKDAPSSSFHAKCASGVPFLMSVADEKAVISKRLDSPPVACSPSGRISSRWELCQHIFFGNLTAEDIWTQSPCSEPAV